MKELEFNEMLDSILEMGKMAKTVKGMNPGAVLADYLIENNKQIERLIRANYKLGNHLFIAIINIGALVAGFLGVLVSLAVDV